MCDNMINPSMKRGRGAPNGTTIYIYIYTYIHITSVYYNIVNGIHVNIKPVYDTTLSTTQVTIIT